MKILIVLLLSNILIAAENPICENVRLSDIAWTDVTSTTAVTSEILTALNYKPKISVLSMPVTFAGLKNNDLDVFLGNWMPSQEADIRPYLRDGSVVQMSRNLEGARYTLAVPQYVYDAGVRSFADFDKFSSRFKKQIYGIEPGNDGNRLLLKMISDDAFALNDWHLVESSEQGMLVAVKQAVYRREWVVFLAWAPHPMNLAVKMQYLSGGDAYFGPNMGDSSVYTVTRKGFELDCPRLAQTLKQIKFTVDMENQIMSLILDDHMSPQQAAQKWLGANINVASAWLKNTETYDGKPGDLAFKKYLLRVNNFGDSPAIARIPLGFWIERGTTFLTDHFSKQFHNVSDTIESVMQALIAFALKIPSPLIILILSAFAYVLHRSIWLSLGVIVGLFVILNLGLWVETVQTFVLVMLASFISVAIGIPLGVLATRRTWIYAMLRPMLDLMQTIPTFVYLIPTLMLFGLGVVPGLISTIIFAVAAPIRLTYLGIKGVPPELVEAAEAFGATPMQRLIKVQIPGAWPSIMTGLTQCIMLSLSMVVIAALVGAEGLGTPVVRALNTVNIRQGFEAGLAIVIVAILLDRTLTPRGKKI